MSERYSLFSPEYESVRIAELGPKEDAILLTYIARYGSRIKSMLAQRVLNGALVMGPEDETPDNDTRYWLILKAAKQENNVDWLKHAALEHDDELFSKAAFARLTGCGFYEPCDSYSHRNFSCGRAEGMTDSAVLTFCEQAAVTASNEGVRSKARELMNYFETKGKDLRGSQP